MLQRVPAERYFDKAYADLEWERLWTRVWLLAGHVCELPSVGSWFTWEIGRESLLIVRSDTAEFRAFYNVCQHRGNRLCSEERGSGDGFRCAYHHWEYQSDGRLRSAPGAELGAGEAAGIRLPALRCEVRHGFVWISMAPRGETLDEFLSPIATVLSAHHPEVFRLRDESIVEVAANWKTSVDVSNESYHLGTLHPELLEVLDPARVTVELCGIHSRMNIPIGLPGKTPPPVAGAPTDKHQLYLFPNVQLNFSALGLEVYRHRPHPTEPERMFFDEQAYLRVGPSTDRSIAPRRRRFRHGEAALGPVMGADVDLLPGLQRGMRSRGFPGLHLTPQESCIANMHRALDLYLSSP